jgi:hypothetical protein
MSLEWTEEEIKEFDRLLGETGSRNQLERIIGRLDMTKFVEKHGKEKCDAMFAHLEGHKKES